MHIKALGESKFRVDLTKNDLLSLNTSYEKLDYSNIETRRLLQALFKEAAAAFGITLDSAEKLFIEVFEKENGGCVIYFTLYKSSEDKMPQSAEKAEAFVFEAFDENAFTDALTVLKTHAEPDLKPVFFTLDGKLFIVLDLKEDNSHGILFCLCEFGEIYFNNTKKALNLFEYGTPIHTL